MNGVIAVIAIIVGLPSLLTAAFTTQQLLSIRKSTWSYLIIIIISMIIVQTLLRSYCTGVTLKVAIILNYPLIYLYILTPPIPLGPSLIYYLGSTL